MWLALLSLHPTCTRIVRLKVLARHSSVDPRLAQSNESEQATLTRSHSLRVHTPYALAKPLVCETSADSLVSETSTRNEFYTHALAIL